MEDDEVTEAVEAERFYRYNVELTPELGAWLDEICPSERDRHVGTGLNNMLQLDLDLGFWLEDEATRRSRESRAAGTGRVTKRAVVLDALKRLRRQWGANPPHTSAPEWSRRWIIAEALRRERKRSASR